MSWKPALLLAAVLGLGDASPRSAMAADRPIVSIVTDAVAGKGANHGMEKLTAALRARNVPFEHVDALDSTAASSCLSWDWPAAKERPHGC